MSYTDSEKRELNKKRCRAYHAAHREENNAKRTAYYAKHREEAIKKQHIYNNEHREEINKRQVIYEAEHKEERRIRDSLNRENISKRMLAWQRANKEKMHAYGRKYRANKYNAAINDFTHTQWLMLQESFDHRCAYCGKRRKGHLTQDHLTPLSKGGNHTLTNIIPACQSCNSKKNAGPPLTPVQPLLL